MVIWPPTTAAAAAFRLLSSRLRNVWHISRHFFSWKCHRQGESPFVKLSAVRAGARETKQRRKKLEGKEPANNRRTRNGTSQRFMAYHFFFRLHKTTDIAFPFWSVKKRQRSTGQEQVKPSQLSKNAVHKMAVLGVSLFSGRQNQSKSVWFFFWQVFRFLAESDDQMNYFGLQHCSRSDFRQQCRVFVFVVVDDWW